jgi:hypothetical protein
MKSVCALNNCGRVHVISSQRPTALYLPGSSPLAVMMLLPGLLTGWRNHRATGQRSLLATNGKHVCAGVRLGFVALQSSTPRVVQVPLFWHASAFLL